ncbi:MAG: alpha/beta hydrolase [Chloroflexota bacterium]
MIAGNRNSVESSWLHQGQPVLAGGAPLTQARRAMVMFHGRGANAADILGLAGALHAPGMAFLAPQARANTWYPNRFLAPTAGNQPWLDSALQLGDDLLAQIAAAGIPAEQTYLLGFSQGACLALEYAARRPQRYAGVFGLSGGLIGSPQEIEQHHDGLNGTPVLLGCSDIDPHIPLERVQRSAAVLERLGAQVTLRIYPGMGHIVNQDEIEVIQARLDDLQV